MIGESYTHKQQACDAWRQLPRETPPTYHCTSDRVFRYRLRLLQRAVSAMASEEPQAKKQKLSGEEEETEKEENKKTNASATRRWPNVL